MEFESEKLQGIKELIVRHGVTNLENVDLEKLKKLRKIFGKVDDIRCEPKVKHLLGDVVMIVLLAVISGIIS
ncbi:hypothetical protein FACS189465_3280 [Clostridia bacterium]|nr:hypothetical protein FACS189465_3280 [Clostridia bacterium]